MPFGNVPDDWDMYWVRCDECGHKYHLSEGGCYCYQERMEKQEEELFDRLTDKRCKIDLVERGPVYGNTEDALGYKMKKGQTEVRLYIEDHNGIDEVFFTEENWKKVKKIIGYKEIEDD